MRKTSEAEAYREMREHLMSHINHDKRGFSRPASVLMTYLLVCMAIGWGTMAIHDHIVIQRLQEELAIPPGVIKMHGLKVTQRSGPRHFEALVKDPFDAEWSKFHANVCPGSTITNEIQAGVTLTLWQYVEDPLRNCMDLSNQRITGYSLERNPDGTPVIDILTAISVSGQAASPRTSASTAR
jgi:hypothetical protein